MSSWSACRSRFGFRPAAKVHTRASALGLRGAEAWACTLRLCESAPPFWIVGGALGAAPAVRTDRLPVRPAAGVPRQRKRCAVPWGAPSAIGGWFWGPLGPALEPGPASFPGGGDADSQTATRPRYERWDSRERVRHCAEFGKPRSRGPLARSRTRDAESFANLNDKLEYANDFAQRLLPGGTTDAGCEPDPSATAAAAQSRPALRLALGGSR